MIYPKWHYEQQILKGVRCCEDVRTDSYTYVDIKVLLLVPDCIGVMRSKAKYAFFGGVMRLKDPVKVCAPFVRYEECSQKYKQAILDHALMLCWVHQFYLTAVYSTARNSGTVSHYKRILYLHTRDDTTLRFFEEPHIYDVAMSYMTVPV